MAKPIRIPVTAEEALDFKRLMEWAQDKLPFTTKALRHLGDSLSASVQRGCTTCGILRPTFVRKTRGRLAGATRITVCPKCSRATYRQLAAQGTYDNYPGCQYELEYDTGEVDRYDPKVK